MSAWQVIERFYLEKLLLSYNAPVWGWSLQFSAGQVSSGLGDDLKYYQGACSECAEWALNEQEYFPGPGRDFTSWYLDFLVVQTHAVINAIKSPAASWNSESNYEAASCMAMALSRMCNLYLLVGAGLLGWEETLGVMWSEYLAAECCYYCLTSLAPFNKK